MKADFDKMTNEELREYALTHREEVEPLRILFNRRSPEFVSGFISSSPNPRRRKRTV